MVLYLSGWISIPEACDSVLNQDLRCHMKNYGGILLYLVEKN